MSGSRKTQRELNYLISTLDTKRINSRTYHFGCPVCGQAIGRSGYAIALTGGMRLYCNQPGCAIGKSQRPKGVSMVEFVKMTDPKVRGYAEASEAISKQRIRVEVDLSPNTSPKERLRLPVGSMLIGHGGGSQAELARSYLSGRGYDLKELHNHYRISYHPTSNSSHPDYSYVIIPFFDACHRLVYYQKRSFIQRSDGKRWDNPSADKYGVGKSQLIFNESALFSGHDQVIVTEGATDSLTLGTNCVGTLGLSMSSEVVFKLTNRASPDVVFMLDSGAWLDCLLNASLLVDRGDPNVFVVPMYLGEDDPNTLGRSKSLGILESRKFRLTSSSLLTELDRVERISGKTYRSQSDNLSWI